MSMVPVTLDFRASPASGSRLGKLLAALGAAAMLASGVAFLYLGKSQFDLDGKVQKLKVELRHQQDAGLAAAAVDPDGEIAKRLARPWQRLFLALESVSDARIALLEIRPDPGRRTLRLSGEAGNLEEALEYLRRVQKLPELTRSHLVSYSVVQAPGAPPALRFIIQADWVDA